MRTRFADKKKKDRGSGLEKRKDILIEKEKYCMFIVMKKVGNVKGRAINDRPYIGGKENVMITQREMEILERAIKVSAYDDDDAFLILKGLLLEKNAEIDRREVMIQTLRKENTFLKNTLAEFEGVKIGGSD